MLGEVINWWTVVLLVWCGVVRFEFFRKRRAQQRCENDNIPKSTFTLIGRRALQMCICHKHDKNKTHNGNAFHNRNLVCFYFHFSFDFRSMPVLPALALPPAPLPIVIIGLIFIFIWCECQFSSFSHRLARLFMWIDKLMICHRICHWCSSHTNASMDIRTYTYTHTHIPGAKHTHPPSIH